MRMWGDNVMKNKSILYVLLLSVLMLTSCNQNVVPIEVGKYAFQSIKNEAKINLISLHLLTFLPRLLKKQIMM